MVEEWSFETSHVHTVKTELFELLYRIEHVGGKRPISKNSCTLFHN